MTPSTIHCAASYSTNFPTRLPRPFWELVSGANSLLPWTIRNMPPTKSRFWPIRVISALKFAVPTLRTAFRVVGCPTLRAWRRIAKRPVGAPAASDVVYRHGLLVTTDLDAPDRENAVRHWLVVARPRTFFAAKEARDLAANNIGPCGIDAPHFYPFSYRSHACSNFRSSAAH
jgi:hypothetical protein